MFSHSWKISLGVMPTLEFISTVSKHQLPWDDEWTVVEPVHALPLCACMLEACEVLVGGNI